jgi:hypothetical protein
MPAYPAWGQTHATLKILQRCAILLDETENSLELFSGRGHRDLQFAFGDMKNSLEGILLSDIW